MEIRIVEISEDLQQERDERLFDASGCFVTPGFIETHNHWDGGAWWTPNQEPLPGYGATTSINGNCDFSLAARKIRQTPIQTPQPHRDHVRPPEGLARMATRYDRCPTVLFSALALAATVLF